MLYYRSLLICTNKEFIIPAQIITTVERYSRVSSLVILCSPSVHVQIRYYYAPV